MDDRFSIPTDYPGLTLRQYIAYKSAKDDIERVVAATGMSHKQARALQVSSIRFIVAHMESVMAIEMSSRIIEGKRIVKLNGRTYGLIPDLEAMRFSEFIDASSLSKAAYSGDEPDLSNLIDLFCVLYRPVTERIGDRYRIADYNSDKNSEYRKDIEQLPMDVVTGTLLFFSAICKTLVIASQQYLEAQTMIKMMEAIKEERPTPHSQEATAGTTFWRRLRNATSQSLTRYFKRGHSRYSPT